MFIRAPTPVMERINQDLRGMKESLEKMDRQNPIGLVSKAYLTDRSGEGAAPRATQPEGLESGEIPAETASEGVEELPVLPSHPSNISASQASQEQDPSHPPAPEGSPCPRLSLSVARKLNFVYDRIEMGMACQGEIQFQPCQINRINTKLLFYLDIPVHKYSLPRPTGFGISTLYEAKLGCLGRISYERGVA